MGHLCARVCVFTLFHKCEVHNFNLITSIHLFLYSLYFTFDIILKILLVWESCVPIFTLQVLQFCCSTAVLGPLGTDCSMNCDIENSSSISPMWTTHGPSSLTNKSILSLMTNNTTFVICPMALFMWFCFGLPVLFHLQTVHYCT